jgi:hypothetical protein
LAVLTSPASFAIASRKLATVIGSTMRGSEISQCCPIWRHSAAARQSPVFR